MRKARKAAVPQRAARAFAEIRRPAQQRSRERFEAILDGAERLLEQFDPVDISIHKIAAETGIAPPSIYHFFPETPSIFAALAERYLSGFEQRISEVRLSRFTTWQDLHTYQFRQGQDYFNSHAAARKVLLGPAFSYEIRTRDLNSDAVLAAKSIELTQRLFELPAIPNLLERWVEVIVISDAIWALSIHRYGYITDEMEEQARRARIAYTRTFLPEYLPRRELPASDKQ